MRTVPLTAAFVLFLALLSPAAFAQQVPGAGPGPGMQNGPGASSTPEQFSARKTRILQLIEIRRTRLDEEKTCVESAKNDQDLMNCRPRRPMMRRGGGGRGGAQGGPGQQRPPMGGPGGAAQ